MKRMWLLAALCLIPLVGCYRQTYISLPQPQDSEITGASTEPETRSSYAAEGTAAAAADTVETAVSTQPVGTASPEAQPSAVTETTETGGEPSGEPTAGGPSGDVPEASVPSVTGTGSGDSDRSRSEESKPTAPTATSPPPTAPSTPPVTAPPPITDPPPVTDSPSVTDPPPATEAPLVTDPPPATDLPPATEAPPVTDPPPATEAPSVPPAGGNSVTAEFVLALINQARANAGLSPLGSDGALAGLGGSWDGSGTLLEYLLANGYDCSTAGKEGFSVTDDAYAAELLEEWILSSGGSFLSPTYTRAGVDLWHDGNYILIALYYAG